MLVKASFYSYKLVHFLKEIANVSNCLLYHSAENYLTKDDEYVLSPQDRDDSPEYRPSKENEGHEQDIYDEDHYTLARNSGFGKDFSTSVARKSKLSNSQPKRRC